MSTKTIVWMLVLFCLAVVLCRVQHLYPGVEHTHQPWRVKDDARLTSQRVFKRLATLTNKFKSTKREILASPFLSMIFCVDSYLINCACA